MNRQAPRVKRNRSHYCRTEAVRGARRPERACSRTHSARESTPMQENTSKRRRAGELFADGASQAQVVRAVGVSRGTASAWYRLWQLHGQDALGPPARPGRKPRIDAAQEAGIQSQLHHSPRESGIAADQWSLAAVAALIGNATGIHYHRRHIGRLLRRWGWIIPPFGRHRVHAQRVRRAEDPDGNGLLFIQRRRP